MKYQYKGLVSSDWNECLAPCGPFDFITYTYPELKETIDIIFKKYTGNLISLSQAIRSISEKLTREIKQEQIDEYLEKKFVTYTGVPELVKWCAEREILFMLNTTGAIGYFQRIFARNLFPAVPVLSAHSILKYPNEHDDQYITQHLHEIQDKPKNTSEILKKYNIPSNKVVLIGDSGGDGPHFEWGAKTNALLIGCMTKPSLSKYCQKKDIEIDVHFGYTYTLGEKRDLKKEMKVNFIELSGVIEKFIFK